MTLRAKPQPKTSAPQEAAQYPCRYEYQGLKAQRQMIYAARAQNAGMPQRITNASQKAGYCGTELGPYTNRPGAMTAHALPSRTGQRLHHPDGRVTDLAGRELPKGQTA